jgi:hypothetical protein
LLTFDAIFWNCQHRAIRPSTLKLNKYDKLSTKEN